MCHLSLHYIIVVEMIKEFLLPKGEFKLREGNEGKALKEIDQQPELSLGPSLSLSGKSMEGNAGRKRKRKRRNRWDEPLSQTSVQLQLSNEPLPLDWEQYLDLQSGRMYYLNRKTMEKSWIRPKEEEHQNLSLELNISTLPSSQVTAKSSARQEPKKRVDLNGKMVAVVCINCHLLIIINRSSPSCPNCKYMHILLPTPMPSTSSQDR